MDQINMEKFGTFVSELRRERGLTQRELGDRLFVSDKTVSKWERGVSHSSRYHTRHNGTTLIHLLAMMNHTPSETKKSYQKRYSTY